MTYPLTTSLLSVPKSKVVRGFSFFGVSFIYIIFEDGTDPYWARSRVLEYLNAAGRHLPQGVTPSLGPDATGVGWVYQYALTGKGLDLARPAHHAGLAAALCPRQGRRRGRSRERRRLRQAIQRHRRSAPAPELWPFARNDVRNAIRDSNMDAGGRTVEIAETEYAVRGRGLFRNVDDIEMIVLKA